jgi:hypothetical protein
MSDGEVKFGAFCIAAGLFGYIIYQNADEIKHYLGIALLVVFGVVSLIVFFTILHQQSVEARIWKGMPKEGPMQVNLTIEQSHSTHRLYIDVKMTKRDWEAIKHAGLRGHWLFQHDGVTKMDNHYAVGHLLRVKYVDFSNSIDAHDAKDKLISGLQALRTRIEQQVTFVARPAEKTERLEI